jgi:hypothetical protein
MSPGSVAPKIPALAKAAQWPRHPCPGTPPATAPICVEGRKIDFSPYDIEILDTTTLRWPAQEDCAGRSGSGYDKRKAQLTLLAGEPSFSTAGSIHRRTWFHALQTGSCLPVSSASVKLAGQDRDTTRGRSTGMASPLESLAGTEKSGTANAMYCERRRAQ